MSAAAEAAEAKRLTRTHGCFEIDGLPRPASPRARTVVRRA